MSRPAIAAAAPAPAAPAAPPVQAVAPAPMPRSAMAPLPPAGQAKTRIEPMSTMRIKIAEHMVMSKRTSPHVTTVHRVDMTKVAKMRERYKAQFQANYGFGLTYLPFITRAAVAGLRQYPLLNASLDRQQHHLPQRDSHRHRGRAGKRPDRSRDSRRRREERARPAALHRGPGGARPRRASSSPTKSWAAHSPSPISAASAA